MFTNPRKRLFCVGLVFGRKNGRVRRLQGKPPHKAVCLVRMFDVADGVRNVKNVRIRYSEKLLLSYLRCNCLALNMVKTNPPEQLYQAADMI